MNGSDFVGGSHVRVEGEGPPVVMIHGVGLDLEMWAAQADALAKRYRVIRYDMLGHGKTPGNAGRLTLQDFADQLERLRQALGLDRFALVGLSMGVLVSLKYAMAHGGRLSGLVLMNGVYDRTDEQLAGIRARLAEAEVKGPAVLIDAALDRWLSPEFRAGHPEAEAAIRARLLANDPDDFLTAYRIFVGADPEIVGRLGAIDCPTLVTTGELDRGSTPAMARAMADALPNASCVILPGLRHLPTTEGAEEVNKLLLDFLDRTVAR